MKKAYATGASGVCEARDLIERAWDILASPAIQEMTSR